MKKIKTAQSAFTILLSASLLFAACEKSAVTNQTDQQEIQDARTATESDGEADEITNDVFDNAMGVNSEIGLGEGIGVFGRSQPTETNPFGRTDSLGGPRCFTTTITPLAPNDYPKTVVLDFGAGCVGRDGRIRRGKIITVYTGRMAMPGSRSVTTFNNYYIDSIKVEGTHISVNTSTSNNRSFSVRVENGKHTRPSGDYSAVNSTKTWVQIEGNGTPNLPIDDIFSITGNSSGTVKRGTNTMQWTEQILRAVIRKFTCRWAVRGQKEFTRNNRTSVLDFGNGTCDNQATLTMGGTTYNITLR